MLVFEMYCKQAAKLRFHYFYKLNEGHVMFLLTFIREASIKYVTRLFFFNFLFILSKNKVFLKFVKYKVFNLVFHYEYVQ